MVEWQVSLHTGRPAHPIETDFTDDDADDAVAPPTWTSFDGWSEEVVFKEGEARWGVAVFEDVGASVDYLASYRGGWLGRADTVLNLFLASLTGLSLENTTWLRTSLHASFSLRVFHLPFVSSTARTSCTQLRPSLPHTYSPLPLPSM